MNKPFTANHSSSKLYPIPVQELPGNSLDTYWCLCQRKYFLEIIWISTSSYESPKHSLLWILYPWHAEGNAEHLGIFSTKGKWGLQLQIFGQSCITACCADKLPTPLIPRRATPATVSQMHPTRSSHSKGLKHANYLPQTKNQILKPTSPPRIETPPLFPELKAKPVF